jgi:hypothetical protein
VENKEKSKSGQPTRSEEDNKNEHNCRKDVFHHPSPQLLVPLPILRHRDIRLKFG